jgi:hypothetical protein
VTGKNWLSPSLVLCYGIRLSGIRICDMISKGQGSGCSLGKPDIQHLVSVPPLLFLGSAGTYSGGMGQYDLHYFSNLLERTGQEWASGTAVVLGSGARFPTHIFHRQGAR